MKNAYGTLTNKNYTVGIWDCTFYLVDEDGKYLLNDDGTVKEFYSDKIDMSYWAEGIEPNDLIVLDPKIYRGEKI